MSYTPLGSLCFAELKYIRYVCIILKGALKSQIPLRHEGIVRFLS